MYNHIVMKEIRFKFMSLGLYKEFKEIYRTLCKSGTEEGKELMEKILNDRKDHLIHLIEIIEELKEVKIN